MNRPAPTPYRSAGQTRPPPPPPLGQTDALAAHFIVGLYGRMLKYNALFSKTITKYQLC